MDKTGGVESDLNDHLEKLKRVAKVTAPCSKPDSSKFVEYWVPVQLSDLQLEQYCATLLTKSDALRTFTKSDPVGSLRDVLLSVRKVRCVISFDIFAFIDVGSVVTLFLCSVFSWRWQMRLVLAALNIEKRRASEQKHLS